MKTIQSLKTDPVLWKIQSVLIRVLKAKLTAFILSPPVTSRPGGGRPKSGSVPLTYCSWF